ENWNGRRRTAPRDAWRVGFDYLPLDEIELKTLAAPDLVTALQGDSALGQHFAGLRVYLGAPGGQHRAFETNDKIVRDDGNARLRVVLKLTRFDGFNFNVGVRWRAEPPLSLVAL